MEAEYAIYTIYDPLLRVADNTRERLAIRRVIPVIHRTYFLRSEALAMLSEPDAISRASVLDLVDTAKEVEDSEMKKERREEEHRHQLEMARVRAVAFPHFVFRKISINWQSFED
eukprot:m51a1_g373 hypothetical protein (115) ;mRNA; r:637011-637649